MFRIGNIVCIREDSGYYGLDLDTNPGDQLPGEIIEISGFDSQEELEAEYGDDYNHADRTVSVRWIHSGRTNGYSFSDLELTTSTIAPLSPEIYKYIDDTLESIYPNCWERIDKTIIIYFPEFTIKNSRGNTHIIKELYTRFRIIGAGENKFTIQSPYGLRQLITRAEYDSNYRHSHTKTSNGFEKFCLGDSEVGGLIEEFNAEDAFNPDMFELIMFLWNDFVRWESLEGTPYYSISEIKENKSRQVAKETDSLAVNSDYIYKKFITENIELIKQNITFSTEDIGKVSFDIDSLKYKPEFHQILINLHGKKCFKLNYQYILETEGVTSSEGIKLQENIITFKGVSLDGWVEPGINEDITEHVEYYAHPALVMNILNKFKNEYSSWWLSSQISNLQSGSKSTSTICTETSQA